LKGAGYDRNALRNVKHPSKPAQPTQSLGSVGLAFEEFGNAHHTEHDARSVTS